MHFWRLSKPDLTNPGLMASTSKFQKAQFVYIICETFIEPNIIYMNSDMAELKLIVVSC